MLLKWIHCTVPSASTPAFAEAQQRWSSLADAPGFLGQLGGWSRGSSSEAFILGLWHDRRHYDHFMASLHDVVVERNRQLDTITSSSVVLVDELIAMPGARETIDAGVADAAFLRVSDCVVLTAQSEAFLRAQREVWLPGMRAAGGMLAGSFGAVCGSRTRYLVATLWADEYAHDRYADHMLPELVAKSSVHRQTETVNGIFVRLEPTWTVLAE